MPKKKRPQNTTGAVAGYVRVSDVKAKFPPDCVTFEQRAAFVESLRRLRMAELMGDADRQGETITEWYDDMGISARGEFLVRRVDFDRARRDAQAGRVRKIYARDLSRLFRDLVQQELWFAEMDGYGCAVSIQDLPFIADEATRILLRQNLGSLNQYMATKTGQMLRANHGERVRAGLWVGRGTSVWGLRYNKETHHYDFDPATAGHIRFLVETLVDCGGVAGGAARALNEAYDAGHPRAMLTPQGKRWTAHFVLRLARNRLYARQVHYFKGEPDEILLSRPDLIPEVVDPALLARMQALLLARVPKNHENAEKARASRLDYTYSPFLRCGVCGGPLKTNRPKDYHGRTTTAPGDVPRWLAWVCRSTQTSAIPVPLRCLGFGSVQQRRIDALVGAGLRHALALYGGRHFAALDRAGQPAPTSRRGSPAAGDKAALEAALVSLDTRRRRFHLMYASEQIRDKAELDGYLAEVEDERGRILARLEMVRQASPEPAALPALSEAQWTRLTAQMDALWSLRPAAEQTEAIKQAEAAGQAADVPAQVEPPKRRSHKKAPRLLPPVVAEDAGIQDEALNLAKYELLAALGVSCRLHSGFRLRGRVHVKRDAAGQPVETQPKRIWGKVTLEMELSALGLVGERRLTLTETDEAYVDYRRWIYGRWKRAD